jgi:hypothetical protein
MIVMTPMSQESDPEGRRAFFKTLGRTLVLGVTGAGIVTMVQKGRIETCINVMSPCRTCVALNQGCELPKAMDHRRMESHGGSTPS